jgi:radical SAM protein with 4Fe4S-binding SPASM domain
LGKRLGVTSINFFPIVPFGRASNLGNTLLLKREDYKKFLIFFSKKQKEIHGIKLLGDFPLEILIDNEKRENLEKSLGRVCPAGVLSMVISWNGDVYPCPLFPIKAGNVYIDPIEKIWRESPIFKEIRNIKRFKGKCASCINLNICRGGCIARTYIEKGNISEEDPYCWYNESS